MLLLLIDKYTPRGIIFFLCEKFHNPKILEYAKKMVDKKKEICYNGRRIRLRQTERLLLLLRR